MPCLANSIKTNWGINGNSIHGRANHRRSAYGCDHEQHWRNVGNVDSDHYRISWNIHNYNG